MDDLEHRISGLPTAGRPLDGLENDVWTRVRTLRAERATHRLRLAAVAFALGVGVANGGLVASLARPAASEMSVFTTASLPPLARLEAG